jgi:putative CocE/NonD family hydrolase
VDYDEIILRWMDHYLKGVDNGIEREKPVRIFVMGANTWRDEDAWPLTRATETSLYLSSSKRPDGALALGDEPCKSCDPFAEFVSDPARPLSDPYAEFGARDYRSFEGRKDVLLFDSAPLSSDIEVTGPISAEMYVSADVPDFDLWVRLLDVSTDGAAYNLMSPGLDVLRASYRNASENPQLLEPEKSIGSSSTDCSLRMFFEKATASGCRCRARFFRTFRATCRPDGQRSLRPRRAAVIFTFMTMSSTLRACFFP